MTDATSRPPGRSTSWSCVAALAMSATQFSGPKFENAASNEAWGTFASCSIDRQSTTGRCGPSRRAARARASCTIADDASIAVTQ